VTDHLNSEPRGKGVQPKHPSQRPIRLNRQFPGGTTPRAVRTLPKYKIKQATARDDWSGVSRSTDFLFPSEALPALLEGNASAFGIIQNLRGPVSQALPARSAGRQGSNAKASAPRIRYQYDKCHWSIGDPGFQLRKRVAVPEVSQAGKRGWPGSRDATPRDVPLLVQQ